MRKVPGKAHPPMPGTLRHRYTNQAKAPRAFAAGIAAAIEVGVGLALWLGLAPPSGLQQAVHGSLTALTLQPPPPPAPPKPPPPQVHHSASGKAAPPAARAHAAPVYAPVVLWAKQPPLPVAPQVALAAAAHNGAAPVPGPGSGLAGQGNGSGSGGQGNGNGDGTGHGAGDGGTEPDWIGGRIKPSDYPAAARATQAQGTTSVTLGIDAKGHATACRITRSSHNAALDSTTCDLALKRFRFRPARDATGHAVAGAVDYDQEWTIGDPAAE